MRRVYVTLIRTFVINQTARRAEAPVPIALYMHGSPIARAYIIYYYMHILVPTRRDLYMTDYYFMHM